MHGQAFLADAHGVSDREGKGLRFGHTVKTVSSTVLNVEYPGFFSLVDILGVSFLLTLSFFYFSSTVLGTCTGS